MWPRLLHHLHCKIEFLNEATYDPSKYSMWLCFCLQISRLTIFLYAWQILKGFWKSEVSMSKDYIHSAVSFVAQANTVFIIQHSTDKYCTNTRKIHLKTITPKTRMKIRNQSQTNFSSAKNWFWLWFGFFFLEYHILKLSSV